MSKYDDHLRKLEPGAGERPIEPGSGDGRRATNAVGIEQTAGSAPRIVRRSDPKAV